MENRWYGPQLFLAINRSKDYFIYIICNWLVKWIESCTLVRQQMLESVNKVYEYMLWYNIKNMQKSDPEDDQIKELQKMKDEALEEMFIQRL